jgi:exonuclease III
MSTHKLTESETVCNLNCFQDLVYSEQIDIVCVNETWLNGNIDDSEILNSDYTILRKDRETRGGGVLLAIKTDSFKSVREVHQNQYIEIISAEITTSSNSRLLICSCYRPPNADQNWLNNFNHYLNDVCSCYENIILVGDFNMPHISWNSPENTTGAIEISFLDLMNDYFLSQLNNKPTRRNNVLDLVLTNVPNLVNIHEVLSPTEAEFFTDHNISIFNKTSFQPI